MPPPFQKSSVRHCKIAIKNELHKTENEHAKRLQKLKIKQINENVKRARNTNNELFGELLFSQRHLDTLFDLETVNLLLGVSLKNDSLKEFARLDSYTNKLNCFLNPELLLSQSEVAFSSGANCNISLL